MAPSIELYNDKVPKISWEELLKDPYYQILSVDNIHYFRLTKFLLYLTKKINKEDIIIIENHKHVFYHVNEKTNIINIDHHHDLGYKDDNPNPELNCGNWVEELGKNKLLNEYVWIHNWNSIMPEKNECFLTKHFCLQDMTELNNYKIKIDKLILCLSEPWIPPYIRPLFYIWIEFLNNYYNCHFDIIYDSKENLQGKNINDFN